MRDRTKNRLLKKLQERKSQNTDTPATLYIIHEGYSTEMILKHITETIEFNLSFFGQEDRGNIIGNSFLNTINTMLNKTQDERFKPLKQYMEELFQEAAKATERFGIEKMNNIYDNLMKEVNQIKANILNQKEEKVQNLQDKKNAPQQQNIEKQVQKQENKQFKQEEEKVQNLQDKKNAPQQQNVKKIQVQKQEKKQFKQEENKQIAQEIKKGYDAEGEKVYVEVFDMRENLDHRGEGISNLFAQDQDNGTHGDTGEGISNLLAQGISCLLDTDQYS